MEARLASSGMTPATFPSSKISRAREGCPTRAKALIMELTMNLFVAICRVGGGGGGGGIRQSSRGAVKVLGDKT